MPAPPRHPSPPSSTRSRASIASVIRLPPREDIFVAHAPVRPHVGTVRLRVDSANRSLPACAMAAWLAPAFEFPRSGGQRHRRLRLRLRRPTRLPSEPRLTLLVRPRFQIALPHVGQGQTLAGNGQDSPRRRGQSPARPGGWPAARAALRRTRHRADACRRGRGQHRAPRRTEANKLAPRRWPSPKHRRRTEDDGSGRIIKAMAGSHELYAVQVAVAETLRAAEPSARR